MCKKHTEKRIDSIDNENDEVEDNKKITRLKMTREEFERKFRKHMNRRKEAYVKMGTVDEPRE
jgi:hypothetical protein